MPNVPCEECAYCRELMDCPYKTYYQARCICGRFTDYTWWCGREQCEETPIGVQDMQAAEDAGAFSLA